MAGPRRALCPEHLLWMAALAACTPSIAPPAPVEPATEAPPEPSTEAPAAPTIIDRPIPWNAERRRLTREYLHKHMGVETLEPAMEQDLQMVPRMIVLHWTAGTTAKGAWNTFAPTELPGRPDIQRGGLLNVSAHLLVHQDGTIWRLMPEDRVARHVIGMNHLAIGIENVGGVERMPLTAAQVEANVDLVRHLHQRFPTITHLIGHMEYRAFEGHPYFQETDPDYRTTKPDPGEDFLRKVRAGVQDLGLEGPPGR